MRRVQLVLAALAIVVASFAAISSPAMADDWNNHKGDDSWNNNWRWNNDEDNNWRWNNDEDNNWWGWNDWNTNWWWNNHVQDCPFWGDTSGVVNQWDCFD
jgi:hypothetical protein